MIRLSSSGDFSPAPSASPMQYSAPGVRVRPPEPHCEYSRFGKKLGTCRQPLPCPSSLGGPHTCVLSNRVFTCAVPRGACRRAGNRGMKRRTGKWEGQSTAQDSQIRRPGSSSSDQALGPD